MPSRKVLVAHVLSVVAQEKQLAIQLLLDAGNAVEEDGAKAQRQEDEDVGEANTRQRSPPIRILWCEICHR